MGIPNTSQAPENITAVHFDFIKSKVQNFRIPIKCFIDKILDVQPNEFFSIDTWEFPKYLTLANPQFNIPRLVDLLLGSNVFWKVLKHQTLKLKNLISSIFDSKFGWLIGGNLKPCSHSTWLDKSHLKFDRSHAVGTQRFTVTRAGLTRLNQAPPFPQFVGKIAKHQRRVAWQITSMAQVVFPRLVVCFQFLHLCTYFFTFFFLTYHFLTYFASNKRNGHTANKRKAM